MRLAYIVGCILTVLTFLVSVGSVNAHPTHRLIEKIQETHELKYAYLHRMLSESRKHAMQRAMPNACEKIVDDIERKEKDSKFALTGSASLETGAAYYTAHKNIFESAEQKYGIPSEYLLAFLRVETYFGACVGRYNLLSRLHHIYINAPTDKQRTFARREIGALLALSKEHDWDPHSIFGSKWGAFGLTQFLPSSLPKFAVDGDGNGDIDLFSPDDAIPSTARFLKINHWDTNKRAAIWNYNHSGRFVHLITEYAEAVRPYIHK